MPSEADRRQLLVHAPTPGWTRSRHTRSPSSPGRAACRLSAQEVDNWARAEHRNSSARAEGDSALSKRIEDNLLVAVHPVVRVHPITKKKCLFVNPGFTSHIVDLSHRESKAILDLDAKLIGVISGTRGWLVSRSPP